MLLGNWAIYDTVKRHLRFDKRGFEFFDNDTCEFKLGFTDEKRYENDTVTDRDNKVHYSLGNLTKYILNKEILKIYNLSYKRWDTYKIRKLSNDTLVIGWNKSWTTFVKKRYDVKKVPDFDSVIVSSSICFGACPMVSIMISKDGYVSYNGSYHTSAKGDYTSKISKKEFNEIALRFKRANYFMLKESYNTAVTDSRTVSVLFIKDGKIVKSVEDYASSSPDEFTWAYNPVILLYQSLNLVKEHLPDYTKPEFMMSHFKSKTNYLDLTDAETYYLVNLVKKGKEGNFSFSESYDWKYKNDAVNRVSSDGRYYKFQLKDKTTRTFDIGYNFITDNKFVNKIENIK
ncbi:DUF6438 domain-containing protein [Flavobacterium rivuli]|nr:DUF6438 domain-containing protein [Flavobacterium rivuli]